MTKYLVMVIVAIVAVSCGTVEVKRMKIKEPLYITAGRLSDDTPRGKSRSEMKEIFKMANSYFDSERFEEAEKLYEQVVDNYQKTADQTSSELQFCYYNLGLIASKNKEWDKAEKMFLSAYQILQKESDSIDAFMLLLEAYRNGEKWKEIKDGITEVLDSTPPKLSLSEEKKREIILRKAEAKIMLGDVDEGRQIVRNEITNIRRGKLRKQVIYNPEYAMAQYILGKSYSYEFTSMKLEENIGSLAKKCSFILKAQSYYLYSIKTGIMYWTNASAFETAKLYTDLYREMIGLKLAVEGKSDEEKDVYLCELWKKISGLLRKARRALKSSIEVAKKINIDNEYTDKSFQMLIEIEEIYTNQEKYCENPFADDKKE